MIYWFNHYFFFTILIIWNKITVFNSYMCLFIIHSSHQKKNKKKIIMFFWLKCRLYIKRHTCVTLWRYVGEMFNSKLVPSPVVISNFRIRHFSCTSRRLKVKEIFWNWGQYKPIPVITDFCNIYIWIILKLTCLSEAHTYCYTRCQCYIPM